jgi:predicted SAM-dependent methyltransferase
MEWRRVLKPSGVLRLSVPDFDLLLRIYHAQGDAVESIVPMLLGAQDYPANQHLGIFNQRFLRLRLEKAGFREVRAWDPSRAEHHEFDDWAGRLIELGGERFPVSLNLEAVK